MTCEELLQALNDFIDDETTLAVCEEFASHLAACNPCQLVVDNIRKSIQLYRSGKPYEMPPEFNQRLRMGLRAKWKEKYPDSKE